MDALKRVFGDVLPILTQMMLMSMQQQEGQGQQLVGIRVDTDKPEKTMGVLHRELKDVLKATHTTPQFKASVSRFVERRKTNPRLWFAVILYNKETINAVIDFTVLFPDIYHELRKHSHVSGLQMLSAECNLIPPTWDFLVSNPKVLHNRWLDAVNEATSEVLGGYVPPKIELKAADPGPGADADWQAIEKLARASGFTHVDALAACRSATSPGRVRVLTCGAGSGSDEDEDEPGPDALVLASWRQVGIEADGKPEVALQVRLYYAIIRSNYEPDHRRAIAERLVLATAAAAEAEADVGIRVGNHLEIRRSTASRDVWVGDSLLELDSHDHDRDQDQEEDPEKNEGTGAGAGATTTRGISLTAVSGGGPAPIPPIQGPGMCSNAGCDLSDAENRCACGRARYCSKEHQAEDWPWHKPYHGLAALDLFVHNHVNEAN